MVSISSTLGSAVPVPLASAKTLLLPGTIAGKVRSRNEAGMDFDADLAPPNSAKRLKSTLQSDLRIQSNGEVAIGLIQFEVRRAIERHRVGDNGGYDSLRELFSADADSTDRPSTATLRNHLLALMGNVSFLNKSCSSLVGAVLDTDWLGRDDGFVALYIRFIGLLVSAQGVYLSPVLSMLVGNLTRLPFIAGHLPDCTPVRRSKLYTRTHTAIKYVIQVIPSASRIMTPILAANFPKSREKKTAHQTYIRNLLELVRYVPELRSDALNLITDRTVKVDLQIQVDLEDLEDDVGDTFVPGLNGDGSNEVDDSDNDSDDSDAESSASDDLLDDNELRLKVLRTNIEKVDSTLDTLFEFYEPSFDTIGDNSEHIFSMLLGQFENVILPTYRSRHTGFLLFHFAQKSQYLIDRFVGACFHFSIDKGRSAILRQSSAAFLASFVARGAHVPGRIVRDVYLMIGAELDSFREEHEATCRGPNLRLYATYYAMVQALLYIFCFRWRDFVAGYEDDDYEDDPAVIESGGLTWDPRIKDVLPRNIHSRLNPLKVCSPPIVNQFARVAHHLQFLYVYATLESNKRFHLPSSSANLGRNQFNSTGDTPNGLWAQGSDRFEQLDAYFPFDPYNLPVSKRWLVGDYIEWKGIPGLDDPEDGDSDSDVCDEQEVRDEVNGNGIDDDQSENELDIGHT
ncbi:MAG: hypothetical protein M1825_002798 [Sarcosagium campestre]|nr:MAG: hypothetical protein M1825_002798 [Sarcosagium campestre]